LQANSNYLTMKKLFRNLLFFSAIGSVAILASCGGDEEEPLPAVPGLTVSLTVNDDVVTGTEVDAVIGDVLVFDISATAEGGINVIRISGAVSEEFTRTDLGLDAGATTASVEYTLDLAEAEDGDELEIEIEVVDDANQNKTVTYVITVSAPPSPEARAYSAVLLSAPLGATTAEKTSETFFSTSTGMTYSMKTVLQSTEPLSANIDFGYFYGTNTFATLASPAAYPFAYGQANWGTKNETVFRRTTLDETSFSGEGAVKTWADIDAAVEAATAADADPGIESGLEEGEVLAFITASTKTGGSKKGLILIKSITAGDGVNGKIELEILVQEDAE